MNLTESQIDILKRQGCSAEDWSSVDIADGADLKYISNVNFSGNVSIGKLEKSFTMPGGILRHSAIRNVTLHNTTIGDNCLIENIHNYIANYCIGENCIIQNTLWHYTATAPD